MSKKKKVPWKYREHIFTAHNITKFEFTSSCEKRSRSAKAKIKPRRLRPSKVVWIMKGGETVD